MFTGIIEAVGTVSLKQPKGGDLKVRIATGKLDLADVKLGDSIAVNGVCLTVINLHDDGFSADISNETIAHTRWTSIQVGEAVNLEKAMQATSRFGGHIVSGHVDGIGRVVSRVEDARSIRFSIEAPESLAKYIAHKGSITVDGVSLTVNKVEGSMFELNIVPHTAQETTLYHLMAGAEVHLEVDVIARYLERLMTSANPAPKSNLNEGFLAENGFM